MFKYTSWRKSEIIIKEMIIKDINQVEGLKKQINDNIDLTVNEVKKVIQEESIESLAKLKFDKTAFYSLNNTKINFIEMLNQTYSDLVILCGVKELIEKYPGKTFKVNMGALNGFDIVSTDGDVVAECFAVVSVFNNQKIIKDSQKLMEKSDSKGKYIFFYSREDDDSEIEKISKEYRNINYIRYKKIADLMR